MFPQRFFLVRFVSIDKMLLYNVHWGQTVLKFRLFLFRWEYDVCYWVEYSTATAYASNLYESAMFERKFKKNKNNKNLNI